MPLEALRLGCDATALDLNPVAYLALIASLVYPQRFGRTTVDDGRQTADNSGQRSAVDGQMALGEMQESYTAGSRLVDDVRTWAEWVMAQAEAQIGDCHPVDQDGAVPVAYLWAKTIRCPHCEGEVPLIKRRWLHKRKGKTPVAYQLHVDAEAKTYTVEVLEGEAAVVSEPNQGTMRGATVECPYCGTPTEREQIAEQGRAGEMGQHLLVVVLNREDETGRDFRAATEADRAAFRRAEEKLAQAEAEGYDYWGFERLLSVVPDEPTPHARSRATAIRRYGVTEWSHMFNPRQTLVALTFAKEIRNVRDLIATEDPEYAQAVALYIDFILAKQVVYNSKGAWWQPGGLKTAPVMARHDIPITWDYAEANPFSGKATSWESFIESIWRTIEHLSSMRSKSASVQLGSATNLPDEWTKKFDAVIPFV
jgi:adenine-specific DNA methylase